MNQKCCGVFGHFEKNINLNSKTEGKIKIKSKGNGNINKKKSVQSSKRSSQCDQSVCYLLY